MFSSQNSQVSNDANYIEDVFSTYLYTGNGTSQTITNGIDLAGEGGMTWFKSRSNAFNNWIYDTSRGAGNGLIVNNTLAQIYASDSLTAFNADGFSLGADSGNGVNRSTSTYASWTFREQPKFFDVVTYTGNGAGPQVINHNLGSAPGCVIVKSTSNTSVWWVWHRGNGGTTDLTGIELNATSAASAPDAGVASDFTATTFNAGSLINVALNLNPNVNGQTYVAYLFAHNAGGFGLTGTDNVISCGSYSGGSGTTYVTLGYEPQLILKKNATSTGNWVICDNMRGMPTGGNSTASLFPNTSGAETVATDANGYLFPTATGFGDANANSGQTYIYIAIRRGPMKVPTDATKVFSPVSQNAAGTVTTNFPVDLTINRGQSSAFDTLAYDRLRGNKYFFTNLTDAEGTASLFGFDNNTGFTDGNYSPPRTIIYWNWRRAPSFFDEVCVTPSYPTPVTHNLGAVPKLRFEKTRSISAEWKAIYFDGTTDEYELALNSTRAAQIQSGRPALPTSTSFVAYYDGTPIVAYLFAPVTGVQYISKFTGNGSSQTINCGFTGGARFICIKAFSTTGDWKVIDTARGIVSGNDPTLAFNTTSAEVTGTDCIDPDSSGFIVNQESTNNLNVNGVEYLVWAIA